MRLLLFLLFTLLLFGCNSQDSFVLNNGVLLKNNSPFTGTREFKNGSTQKKIQYLKGLKHGEELHFYANNNPYKVYYYKEGKPTGTHKTFYKDGALKKETNFLNGQHHGDYTEFYEDGSVFVYSKYEKGKQLLFKKWRPNGRIYANYIISEGKNIGLSGGKLCINKKDFKDEK